MKDIDLFIGAIQELPTEEDSLVGSTFLCLIGDVFARMRFGDRFFYDNENQAGSFTEGKKYSERKYFRVRNKRASTFNFLASDVAIHELIEDIHVYLVFIFQSAEILKKES